MNKFCIQTARLEGIALYPELTRAAVSNRNKLAQLLNAQVPVEFPPNVLLDVMKLFAQKEEDPNLVGWWGWYFILNEIPSDRFLIGTAGFAGYPHQGSTLLLGYAIIKPFEN